MKKILTPRDTKKIGLLANLKLSESQIEALSKSISSVVGHMEEIKDLDVDKIPETSRMTEEINVWREDIVEPSLSQDEALSGAKKIYNGYFVVPYVFGDEE